MDPASHQFYSFPTPSLPGSGSQKLNSSAKQGSFLHVENTAVRALLDDLLLEPTLELKKRPSHHFRARLVAIGAQLAGPVPASLSEQLAACSDAIEFLHLGSLIIDDIQDGSPVRRNGPALHASLGLPHALSVGNWLYFRALRLLKDLDITAEQRHQLHHEWHEAMELAHYGQVMDLSLSIEQIPLSDLINICYHCALYKTGSIVALAISMGALIQGASPEKIQAVKKLGLALGVYLQQLNDVGNMIGNFDSEKHFEDLLSRKPSFVWSFAIERFGLHCFDQLVQATRALPEKARLEKWILDYSLSSEASAHAERIFDKAVFEFMTTFPKANLEPLLKLKSKIKQAYA